jgi:hypothetical protein
MGPWGKDKQISRAGQPQGTEEEKKPKAGTTRTTSTSRHQTSARSPAQPHSQQLPSTRRMPTPATSMSCTRPKAEDKKTQIGKIAFSLIVRLLVAPPPREEEQALDFLSCSWSSLSESTREISKQCVPLLASSSKEVEVTIQKNKLFVWTTNVAVEVRYIVWCSQGAFYRLLEAG